MASERKGWVQPSLSACDAHDCHHPSEAHYSGQHHPGAPQALPRHGHSTQAHTDLGLLIDIPHKGQRVISHLLDVLNCVEVFFTVGWKCKRPEGQRERDKVLWEGDTVDRTLLQARPCARPPNCAIEAPLRSVR